MPAVAVAAAQAGEEDEEAEVLWRTSSRSRSKVDASEEPLASA